jgi:GH15 family glucan-1,4-alpha-glucosidase
MGGVVAYKDIADYGIIGSEVTVALIGRDGSIDWMCLPYMDSPSLFAAILDDENGGRFLIQPLGEWDSVQEYLPQTNILRTRFRTRKGEVDVTDFMPAGPLVARDPCHRGCLIRRVRGIAGSNPIIVQCHLRFDYARVVPSRSRSGPDFWRLSSGQESISLQCTGDVSWHYERAELQVATGQTLWLSLAYGDQDAPIPGSEMDSLLDATREYWLSWVEQGKIGKYPTSGFWQQQLDRSALVFKVLQFEETGAIAAAPTTSLPAIVHGNRNWDYRYSWVRDTSMTLSTLPELGYIGEFNSYLNWLSSICKLNQKAPLAIVYQLHESAEPEGEVILDHLYGYKESAPVRVGQFVIHQRQHDVYGEMLDTLFAASRFIGKIHASHWEFIRPLVDHVRRIWREPDHGIWEMRTEARHFTHSKLMCWVALDRGIKIAEHYGLPADLSG